MQSKKLLTAALLLGSIAVLAESQERDSSTVHWRGGRSLEKELTETPNDALPLLLEIEVPNGSILAGENFPIRFVVTNPNRMALRFPGTGWTRPRLYASTTDKELTLFVDRSFGVNVGEIGGLTLAPGESVGITVAKAFPRTGAIVRNLHAEFAYTLRLRGAGAVKTVAIEEPGCPEVVCIWESKEIQIPVRAPTTHERKAYQAILDWDEAQVETHQAIFDRNRAPGVPDLESGEEWTLAMVDFRRRFLDEYGDTPYANQVRVLLLRDLHDLPRQKSRVDQERRQPFFPLYVKTVSELLDGGLPYQPVEKVLDTHGMVVGTEINITEDG